MSWGFTHSLVLTYAVMINNVTGVVSLGHFSLIRMEVVPLFLNLTFEGQVPF